MPHARTQAPDARSATPDARSAAPDVRSTPPDTPLAFDVDAVRRQFPALERAVKANGALGGTAVVMDPATGAFINAELGEYKLPRIGDVGEIVIELYEPEDQRDRGVIGLGEPPVISPGAAISNAVANAIGVRVPSIPLTADRVIEALENGGVRT